MPLRSGVSLVHLEEDVAVFVANTSTDPVPVQVVGGPQDVNVTNEVEVKNDAGNPLSVSVGNFPPVQAVSATDLDIRNLSSAQDSVTVTGSVNVGNFPAVQEVDGTVFARDAYTVQEDTDDQVGNGGVLTFTFPQAVQLVYVYAKTTLGTSQARASTGTPSASRGVVCDDGVATAIPVTTSAMKVFAPVGMTVSVWGFRYG
jgi:hypothetical protein